MNINSKQLFKKIQKYVLDRYVNGSFFKNVIILSGGTALSQILILLASPIITRIYGSEDFGTFQLYQSTLNFMVIIGSFRYELAILAAEDDEEASQITSLCLVLTSFLFIFFILCALLFQIEEFNIDFIKKASKFIWLLPFSFFAASIYQTLNNFSVRRKLFKLINQTKIIQSVTLNTGQIIVNQINFKSVGLLWGDFIGKITAAIHLYLKLTKDLKKQLLNVKKERLKILFDKYKQYLLISTPGALLNVAGFAIPVILIGSLYGLRALGFYALVNRLFAAPSLLIGKSVSQVYMSDLNKLIRTDPKKALRLFFNLIKYLALISLPPLIILSPFAPSIFVFIFGNEWKEAGIYFCILAPMQFINFIAWPLLPTLTLLDKQKWQFSWELFRASLSIASIYISYYFALNARNAIGVFALAMLLCYLIHLFLCYKIIKIKINSFSIDIH